MATTEPLPAGEMEWDEANPNPTRNARVVANIGLVRGIAARYDFGGVDYEDRVQFGMFGLMRAAEKFDPSRGLRFSTYATPWIKQAIRGGVADQGRLVQVPLHGQRRGKEALARADAIERETGDRPRLLDVAAGMVRDTSRRAAITRARIVLAAEAMTMTWHAVPIDVAERHEAVTAAW